jgi:hypothetical protein
MDACVQWFCYAVQIPTAHGMRDKGGSRMKESKLIRAAQADGYKIFTSVVKSHYATTYHHAVHIVDIISAGKWIKANCVQFPSGARGRFGVSRVPEKSINKSSAILKYCK